jgi:hypothetical protein
VRKKKFLSQSRQAAKGFSNFFASFLLSEKKKKLARRDAETQRGFFFAPLRLCALNKQTFQACLPQAGLCAFARQKTNNLNQTA